MSEPLAKVACFARMRATNPGCCFCGEAMLDMSGCGDALTASSGTQCHPRDLPQAARLPFEQPVPVEVVVQKRAQLSQVGGGKPALHLFEKLPLLFADVRGEQLCQMRQRLCRERSGLRAADGLAELAVLAEELVHQRGQVGELPRAGEEPCLFRLEVEADLVGEERGRFAV